MQAALDCASELELLPFGWIVDEPIAQLCAWCNIS